MRRKSILRPTVFCQRTTDLPRHHSRGFHTPCGMLSVALLSAGLFGQPLGQETVPVAQQGERSADVRSRRVRTAAEPLALAGCFDAGGWRERLGQPDLDLREAAFDELLSGARSCGAARRTLAVWACSTAEPQLAWTARLALRELDRTTHGGWQTVGQGADPLAVAGDGGLTLRLRSIEELLAGVFDGGGGLSLARPRHLTLPSGPPQARGHRTYSVEVRPDGVRLCVTDGVRSQEYQAPCLDLILENHPQLADEIPGLADMALQPFGSGTRLRWMDGPVRLRIDPLGWRRAVDPERSRTAVAPGVVPFDVLGIECGVPTAEERAVCLVDPDCGVLIRRVVPGTIADALALRRGDILVALDGRAICVPEEISCLMAERDAEASLVVEVVDCLGARRVRTWRPDDSE